MDILLAKEKHTNPALKESIEAGAERVVFPKLLTISSPVGSRYLSARGMLGLHGKQGFEKSGDSSLRKGKRARCTSSVIDSALLSSPIDSPVLQLENEDKELLRSTCNDTERRNRRIASILEQAAMVGQAVEAIHNSRKDSSSVIASSATTYPRFRSRPQRRNSFVIHRNKIGQSGIPVGITPRTVSISVLEASHGNDGPNIAGNTQQDLSEVTQIREVSESSAPSEETADPSQLNSNSTLVDCPKLSRKRQESGLDDKGVDGDQAQPSLLSMWSNSYSRSLNMPVLTEEAKEFYGYE
jgi:hypothetical protein